MNRPKPGTLMRSLSDACHEVNSRGAYIEEFLIGQGVSAAVAEKAQQMVFDTMLDLSGAFINKRLERAEKKLVRAEKALEKLTSFLEGFPGSDEDLF